MPYFRIVYTTLEIRDTYNAVFLDCLHEQKFQKYTLPAALYDTSIFEFTSPTLRDTLNHIQKEEQNHGEQLYQYMSKNNMYS